MAQTQIPVQSAPAAEDLSNAIEQSMSKLPGEDVETVHVFGNCYRCNWWVKDKQAHAMFGASGKIIRSQFLRVTKDGDKLVIENLSKG